MPTPALISSVAGILNRDDRDRCAVGGCKPGSPLKEVFPSAGWNQRGGRLPHQGRAQHPAVGLEPGPAALTRAAAGSSRDSAQHAPSPPQGQGFVPERTGIPVSRAINSAPAPAASADLWLLQLILPRCEPFITYSQRYLVPHSHPGGLEEF